MANDEIRLASAFIIGIQASRALIFVGAVLFFGTLRSLLAAAILHGLIQTIVLRVLSAIAVCGILERV